MSKELSRLENILTASVEDMANPDEFAKKVEDTLEL